MIVYINFHYAAYNVFMKKKYNPHVTDCTDSIYKEPEL